MWRFFYIIIINSKVVGLIYFLFYGVFELIKGIFGLNVDNKYRRFFFGIEYLGV